MASSINPDLQKERDTASFDVEEMTNLLEDGRQVARRQTGQCMPSKHQTLGQCCSNAGTLS